MSFTNLETETMQRNQQRLHQTAPTDGMKGFQCYFSMKGKYQNVYYVFKAT